MAHGYSMRYDQDPDSDWRRVGMSFSLAENPELILGGAVVLCLVFFVTFKFVRKRNVNVKADNGSAAVNGKNSGNITINHRNEKP
ncbi:hypothetical protein DND67_17455 [Pseudomonas syringae pv. pisi]|nr:hypothetical protein DND67_17455 [Pseudomonas syringae pv. pisi]